MKHFGVGLLLFTTWYLLLAPRVFAQNLPSLQISSPIDGEVVSGNKVLVKFQVVNFKFVDFRKTDLPRQNEGHLHIWLDEKNPTAQNAIKHISTEQYLLPEITPGGHGLALELVHSDHSSFSPKISQVVNFKTVGVAPTSTPTSNVNENQPVSPVVQVAIGVLIALAAVSGLAYFTLRRK